MDAAEVPRAVAAARSIAAAVGLTAHDATVVHSSNRLAVRLQPCDVLARVAPAEQHRQATFEVELAQQLSAAGAPVGTLDPRVDPLVHEHGGFVVTLWTYYEPQSPLSPDGYARALQQHHAALRMIDLATPRYSDRVAEARAIVEEPERSPALVDADRALLLDALLRQTRAIDSPAAIEQPLHGEPHPGNLLSTSRGPRFIDLETCCRGPIELDLAYVPEAVSGRYPGVQQARLGECRGLVLAMVAAWRWDRHDQLPNGPRAGHDLLDALRAGPPWPTLTGLMPPA